MHSYDFTLILAFFVLVLLPAPFIGRYLYRVMEGEKTWLSPVLQPVERLCYRIAGVDSNTEQDWKTYTLALLAFTLISLVTLFSILMLQGSLPLNPQQLPGLEWTLAFNTAVSFVTNTNWQAYSGEASLSYFSQMVGLGVQNFVSPAVGLAVLVVFCRGIARRSSNSVGNFWVDLTRATLYGLLPFCLVLALFLVWQGVPQTFLEYVTAHTLGGTDQVVPLGPAASQIAIKQLGTNGGGFFGVNSAHPFENPTAWSNLFEVASIILIPAALLFTFGHYVKDLRQSRALLACMLILFSVGLGGTLYAEHQPNPALAGLPIEQSGSLEGKESRFGTTASALWAVTTTAASNGSVNAMHDSFSALGGMIPMFNMMLGEVIFGGVGAGLYGMLLFVLIAVFLNYTSGAANNGSAFGGFGANTPYHNLMIGLAMLIGRFGYILPILAIAGSLAAKKRAPVGSNSFPTHGPLFVTLLTLTILLVGGLTFLPALALGPIAEHMTMFQGF